MEARSVDRIICVALRAIRICCLRACLRAMNCCRRQKVGAQTFRRTPFGGRLTDRRTCNSGLSRLRRATDISCRTATAQATHSCDAEATPAALQLAPNGSDGLRHYVRPVAKRFKTAYQRPPRNNGLTGSAPLFRLIAGKRQKQIGDGQDCGDSHGGP